jgi:hypothetical protein
MQIRIWKLGSLEHRMLPTEAAIDQLWNILDEWDGVSDLDVVWGPDLTLEIYDCGDVMDIDYDVVVSES